MAVLANAVRRERAGAWTTDCVLMRVRERRKFEDELLRARKEAERARADVEEHAEELRVINEQLEQQALELERVDMSRTRRSEGSGLGLAISRDLAAAWATSCAWRAPPASAAPSPSRCRRRGDSRLDTTLSVDRHPEADHAELVAW